MGLKILKNQLCQNGGAKMKASNIILTAVIVSFLFTTPTLAYSDNGPSEDIVRKLFTAYFKNHTPAKWVKHAAVGKIKSIEFVKISMGKSLKEYNNGQLPAPYNSDSSDCYPIQLSVKGVALSMFNNEINFEDNPRFMLCVGYPPNPRPIFYPQGDLLVVKNGI